MNYILFDQSGDVAQQSTECFAGAIELTNAQLHDRLVARVQEKRAVRYAAEASVYDLADAETKLASPDPTAQAEGVAQKAAVLAKRLQIKSEIPKPQ